MKILLINPPIRLNEKPSNFPFGLGYIAAVLLREGYKVDVLDINGCRYNDKEIEKILRRKLIEDKIDVVGIGCLITCYSYVKWLIKTIKQINPNVKIIVGGGLGSSVPEMTIKNLSADIVVIGEGETTILELMRYFEKKRKISSIKGIYYFKDKEIIKNPLRIRNESLDNIPLPARELFPMNIYIKNSMEEVPDIKEKGNGVDIVTGRGCYYKCTYCYDPLGHSRTLRSVENVIKEIILLKEKYKVNYLFFTDPCFVLNKKWVYELCNEIIKKKLNVRWVTSARVNLVDEPLLRKMKEAGCIALNYGIESGSQRMLNIMRKGVTVEQASKAVMMTRKAGIKDWLSFIIGFPEETKEDIEQTIKFCINNDIHLVAIFFATAYPGTALYEQVKNMGLIKNEEEYVSKLGDATDLVLNISKFSDNELKELRDYAIRKVRRAYFKRHKIEQFKWYIQKIQWAFLFIRKQGIFKFSRRVVNYLRK